MTLTYHPPFSLAGKTALITGASRGIGAAVAKAYAKAGAQVIAVARSKSGLEALDDHITDAGNLKPVLVELDIRDGEAIDRLGAALYERFKALDILVGNAGVLGTLTPLSHLQPAEWQRVIDTNLTANFRLLRSLHPLLKQASTAQVLMVSSGVTSEPMAYWGAYSISKVALEWLVQTYNAENHMTNIRAHSIDPGEVDTDMHAQAFPGLERSSFPAPETAEVLDRFFAPLRPLALAA